MVKEVNTLISLLEDNDNEVISAVTSELLNKGVKIIPYLEKAWEKAISQDIQEKLEGIIYNIQLFSTRNKLKSWLDSGADDLLAGATYIAQFQYPNIQLGEIRNEIRKISSDIYLSAHNNLAAIEKVRLLNYVIYELNNFSRNTANFYSPQNSFINQVLETRKGNPISLGIVYLSVAHNLGLPIYGVNLPKSFILAYINEYRHSEADHVENDVLFYINPYNNGAIVNKREIDYFLIQQNIKPNSEFYSPCDNKSIVIRLITNLIVAYQKLGFDDKSKMLESILAELSQESRT